MIVKLFSTVIGLLGATLLFWVGIAFEHRPAGWPNIELHAGPFPIHVHLPDGPYARLGAILAAEKAAAAHTQRVQVAQAAVSVQAARAEDIAQVRIRTITKEIVREVPVYVSAAADDRCVVPVGVVRVLDAAAASVPVTPDPAGKPNDSASGLELSTVAENVAGNYGAANANAEQLKALQAWITAEAAATRIP